MSNLRGLDLNLLVMFEAIYSTKNISHASKQLGVSQPTISNSLTRLRETLDDQLFVRKGRGVEPTSKATKMIGPVREALQMIQSGVHEADEFDPAQHKRHFRLLMIDPCEPILMPPVIRQIDQYKSITLEALPLVNAVVSDMLNDGSIDLAFSNYFGGINNNEMEAIGAAKLVVVARKNHPAIKSKFTLDHFQSLGHIALISQIRARSALDEELHQRQLERHIVYTVSKFWSFPSMVAQTDLIAILPGDFANHVTKYYPLDVYPLPFELPEQQIYMIWKKNRNNDAGHRWLRDQIRQAYRDFRHIDN